MAVSKSGSKKTTSRPKSKAPASSKKPKKRTLRTSSASSSASSSKSSSASTSSSSKAKSSSDSKASQSNKRKTVEDETKAEDKAKSFADRWNDSTKPGETDSTKDTVETEKSKETDSVKDSPEKDKNQNEVEKKETDPKQLNGQEFSDRMQKLAKENPDQLEAILQQSFDGASPEQLSKLKEQAGSGSIPLPENVSFVDGSDLEGADGAYSADNKGTILLNNDLRNDPEAVRRTFTEEMGHHLDSQFSSRDSTGDEGQIFQEGLDNGKPLEKERLQQIRQQNDKGKATINGQRKEVENRRSEPSTQGQKRLAESEQKLKSFNERFESARQMAQRDVDYDAQFRNRQGVALAPQEKQYENLLRRTDRSEADNERMDRLGGDLDSYYRRSGNKFTKLAQGRFDLEQERDSLKAEVSHSKEKTEDASKASPGTQQAKPTGEQTQPADLSPAQKKPTAEQLGQDFGSRMQTLAQENPEQLGAVLEQAFDGASPEQLSKLKQAAADGSIPMPENVSYADPSQLHGATAAYSPDNNGTILLSQDLQSNPEAARRAFTEEMGHHLDSTFSDRESSGDEGQILQEGLAQGKPLDRERAAQLKAENDRGTATIDGQVKEVENRGPEGGQSADDPFAELSRQENEAHEKYRDASSDVQAQAKSIRRVREEVAGRNRRVRSELLDAEKEYREYQNKGSDRSPDEERAMQQIGQQLDRAYGRAGESFTEMAQQRFEAEQRRDLFREQRDTAVRAQETIRENISDGRRVGQPQLSDRQQHLLERLDSPDLSVADRRETYTELYRDLQTGRGPANDPSLADSLAQRMQNGDRAAYSALKGAADRNPRAQQLLDNLQLSDSEKERLDGLIAKRDPANPRTDSALREQFMNRSAARHYIAEQIHSRNGSPTSSKQETSPSQRFEDSQDLVRDAQRRLREAKTSTDRQKIGQELAEARAGQSHLQQEIGRMSLDDLSQFQVEFQGAIDRGERAGTPELSREQSAQLRKLQDPSTDSDERRQLAQSLVNEMRGDRDGDPSVPTVADSLALMMQDGNNQAYDILKRAASADSRSQQLLDNLELNQREKDVLDGELSRLQGDRGHNMRLTDQFRNRGAAAEHITESVTDYIARHTSEEISPKDVRTSPYLDEREAQNAGAQEAFLRKHAGQDQSVANRLEVAKVGQARMDLLEGPPEGRADAHAKLKEALEQPELVPAAREAFANYEGDLSIGATYLRDAGDYESLALLGQAKHTGSYSLNIANSLSHGGRDAAEAVQKHYDHLNDSGRQAAGEFFEGQGDNLKEWLSPTGVEGLAGSVADSIRHQPLEPNRDNPNIQEIDAGSRLDALSSAQTDESRQALGSLIGDQRKVAFRDQVGVEALEGLENDPEGRDQYFEALRSESDANRRQALQVDPDPFPVKYTVADKEQLLSSTAQALGRTEDSELRAKAMERIYEFGAEEPTFRGEDAVSFQSRAETYGALLAQADKFEPDSEKARELSVLANDVANGRRPGRKRDPRQAEISARQQRLDAAVLGENTQDLVDQMGRADSRSLVLTDARLRHAGQPGLVGKLSDMKAKDPATYQALLRESTRSEFGKPSGQLAEFLGRQAESAPKLESNTTLSREQQTDLRERLGADLGGRLSEHSDHSPAAQLAADVERTQAFSDQISQLERRRSSLEYYNQDTSEIDQQIEQKTKDFETTRFDSQGLEGRMKAVESLGDRYQEIQQLADQNNLNGREFDQLLMKSAEMQNLGNQDGLNTLLSLGGEGGGLKSSEMNLMMDMAVDMPSSQFNTLLGKGRSAEQVRQGFGDAMMRDMHDFARGDKDRWFEGPGKFNTRGQRMIDFLVDSGRGGDLLYNPEGGGSTFDRMMLSDDASSRRMASRLADRVVEKSSPSSVLNRAGRMAQEKINGRPEGESPRRSIERLERLRGDVSKLTGEDKDLQLKVNSEVTGEQARAILDISLDSNAGLENSEAAIEKIAGRFKADEEALPDTKEFKSEFAELEAMRQAVDARNEDVRQVRAGREMEKQKELLLSKDMNSRQIEAMMSAFINSPTDSLSLNLEGKFGLELNAAMFGSAEAYVKGRLGFEIAEAENGKFNISYSGAYGAGVGAEAGVGPVAVGARLEAERFGKHVNEFSSKEEAAKFIAQKLWDTQSALGLKPGGPRPDYNPPTEADTVGTKVSAEAKVGRVNFKGERVRATTTKDQPKPWLAAEERRKRQTEIHTVSDSISAEIDLGGDRSFGLGIEASDQLGDKNAIGNGTALQIRLELGLPVNATPGQVQKGLVDKVMAATSKLDPDGGWKDGKSDAEVREALMEKFKTGEYKTTAKGALEMNFWSNESMMLDQSNPGGELKMNGGEVFLDWAKDLASSNNQDARWQMTNVRTAVEMNDSFSLRARYGTGVVNAFAEVGLNVNYRNATTQLGSMLHGRFMLYGHTQGKSFDTDQMAELQKDGIVSSDPRTRGQINNNVLTYSLGRMRGELMDLYSDPSFREKNLRMPDGSMMSQSRFEDNIDTYLISARDAVYGGVQRTGREQNRDDFLKAVSLGNIREAQQHLDSANSMGDDEVVAYKKYLDFIERADTQPGLIGQFGRNLEQELVRKLRLFGWGNTATH